MVNAASYYCDGIGHLMNYGDGWYGGVYVAAMYSLAFVSDDVNYVVEEALKVIPAESKYYQCIADCIKVHKKYPKDWAAAWGVINQKYSYDMGCPDGVNSAFNIDAVINSAGIVLGLLYGEGNFSKTIDLSTRFGYDSDCNPASAAGILGTMKGYSKIPKYWSVATDEVADTIFPYTHSSLNSASELSLKQALEVIERNGGKVTENSATIAVQKPVAVRYEKGFDGLYVGKTINLSRSISRCRVEDEHRFRGKAVVVKYHFQKYTNYDKDFVAEVEVYVDGKYDKTMMIPVDNQVTTAELYWNYDLEDTTHTLGFKWKNVQYENEKMPVVLLVGKIRKNPEEYQDERGKVTSDYQDELEKVWIDELRQKYDIQVNQEVFDQLR